MMNHDHLRKFADYLLDALLVALSLTAAFGLRFDFSIPASEASLLKPSLFIALLAKMPVIHLAGWHRGLRRYAGLPDLVRIGIGTAVGSALFLGGVLFSVGASFPRSVFVADAILCFCALSMAQFSVRLYSEIIINEQDLPRRKRVLIYGAGVAGVTLLREICATQRSGYEVVGFLDDAPEKNGAVILGVPVRGCGRDTTVVVEELRRTRTPVDEIVIAMPAASGGQRKEALAKCSASGVPCRTIPGLDHLLEGKVLFTQLRDISFADLLGRPAIQLDEAPIRSGIAHRNLLVTGAAGSIGSELCRQVARFDPALLVAFDQAESELFRIDAELRQRFPGLPLITILGDIRDPDRVEKVMRGYEIESVFHAAAYKHVPMMELHPLEAVQNNILGTWNVLSAARRHAVPNFLMISTDKAVYPSSVMGATKRVCELLVAGVSSEDQRPPSNYVSVRFGNVLGSNGSVIPIFQSQIAAGGPVKVTHPEMKRYFMTTAEAVSLVLQASAMGHGSEIFVLDMGEPVRILDLAVHLIKLAGREPYGDIDIQFTGPRPGEKLFEEINLSWERSLPTFHGKIRIFEDPTVDWPAMLRWLRRLEQLAAGGREQQVIEHIQRMVPEYQPGARWQVRELPVTHVALGNAVS
jgi:FlaA1/EpsC-like NDP-sugar epimerase